MSAFHALHLAIDLARTRRDAALQQLHQARQAHAHAQGQLAQLHAYERDTQQRLVRPQAQIANAGVLEHYDQFIARLESTLVLQGDVVARAAERVRAAQDTLAQAEARLKGLQRLLELRLSERARALARREQKQTDEFAAQAHARQLHPLEAL